MCEYQKDWYWIILWRSPRDSGGIRLQTWVNGYRKFSTRKEARDHVKQYRKEYEKEEPGIKFSYHFLSDYNIKTGLR